MACGFQVNWSPSPCNSSRKDAEDILECKLAPFSLPVKVNFSQVPVGTTSSRTVYMKNPGSDSISAKFTLPANFKAAGFQVSSDGHMTVGPGESLELVIDWRPIQSGAFCFTLNVTTNLPRVKSSVQISGSSVLSKETDRRKQRAPGILINNERNVVRDAPHVPLALSSPAVNQRTFTKDSLDSVFAQQYLPVVDDVEPLAVPLDLSRAGCKGSRETVDKENDRIQSPSKSSLHELSFGYGFEQKLLADLSMERECLKSIENLTATGANAVKSSTPMSVKRSLDVERHSVFSPTPVKLEARQCSMSAASRNLFFEVSPPSKTLDCPRSSGIANKLRTADEVKHQISVHSLSPKSIHMFKKPVVPRPSSFVIDKSVRSLVNETNHEDLNKLIAWLNSLLSPLRELTGENSNLSSADVTSAWSQGSKEVDDTFNMAVPRDVACRTYHMSDEQRRKTLVRAAKALFHSEDVTKVLNNLKGKIQSGFLEMKDDRNILHDPADKLKLSNLILTYNPIWLTICLEAMFGKPVTSSGTGLRNSIINFIHFNLLDDKRTSSKSQYYTKYRTPAFKKKMDESIIIKVISLVFFLDYAKTRRIIPFNPCLFVKTSHIKDSEALLNEFICEFIKCATRMKQTFNSIGLSLKYKQSALDEYEMLVTSHLDLRDGVRLARLIEIIFKDCTLSEKLRVPAVSRLQKINNIKVVLSALQLHGITISDDVTPSDVVDGHREKITSLLWQILHKFLLPKKEAAARVVQRWWRSLPVRLKLTRKRASHARKCEAAVKIQSWWRGIACRRRWKVISAPLVEERRRRVAALQIQRWYRARRLVQLSRERFLRELEEARQFAELEKAVRFVQSKVRAKIQGKISRKEFVARRNAAVKIQLWYRARAMAKRERENYLRLRRAAVCIQRRYRARKLAAETRARFVLIRNVAIRLQNWYLMTKLRKNFLKLKTDVVKIQNWYRSILKARQDRQHFLRLKQATLFVQAKFRARRTALIVRRDYLKTRAAAVVIQRRYLTVKCRKNFLQLKAAVLAVQMRYRASLKARQDRQDFLRLKQATLFVQAKFRARRTARIVRRDYLKTRAAAVVVQKYYRSHVQRKRFLSRKLAVQTIQTWYRRLLRRRAAVLEFSLKHRAIVTIQRWYRSVKLTQATRCQFLVVRQLTIRIQRKFRARTLGRVERSKFLELRAAAVTLQSRFRAWRARRQFLVVKSAVVVVQRRFRDWRACREGRSELRLKRETAIRIHRQLVASRNNLAVDDLTQIPPPRPSEFSDLVRAAVRIQRWYRGMTLVRESRRELRERRQKRALESRKTPHGKHVHQHESQTTHTDLSGYTCPCRAQTRRHKTAASTTLRNSFASSLAVMTSGNPDVIETSTCLKNLDFICEHSSQLCEELARQPKALRFIWTAMNKETRVELQQDVICSGFNILINLSLYARTKQATWTAFVENNGCKIVLSLMGKYVSKATPIFCKAATFLWLHIHSNPSNLQYVKTYEDCLKTLAFYSKKISLSSTGPNSTGATPTSRCPPPASCSIPSTPRAAQAPTFRHQWGYGSGANKEFQSKKTALGCLNSYLRFASK